MAAILKLVIEGKKLNLSEPLRGRIILGDRQRKHDEHCLSADCASIEELKDEVGSLKTQLDKLLRRAEKHFAVKQSKK